MLTMAAVATTHADLVIDPRRLAARPAAIAMRTAVLTPFGIIAAHGVRAQEPCRHDLSHQRAKTIEKAKTTPQGWGNLSGLDNSRL